MAIYRFSKTKIDYYDVPAKTQEEAEKKLDECEDLTEYWNDWASTNIDEEPFNFEEEREE